MKLAYQAFDQRGKLVAATIDARDAAEASESLRRQGLYVTAIHASARAGSTAAPSVKRKHPRQGQRLKNMASFSRQLFVLVSSGTPMVQALQAVERQTEQPAWRQIIAKVRERVEEGASLSAAMEEEPEHFDAVCRSLISAGESSGKLAPMLDRLADLSRKQLQRRNAIRGAMIYPMVLLVVGLCVLVNMLLFVLPRFKGLFLSLNVPLPPTTVALLVISDLLKGYWWAALLLIGGTAMGLRYWLASEEGRRARDTAMLKLPRIGKLTRSLASAQIARLLGVLLEGHVPLLEALQLVRAGIGNVHYVELLAQAEETVTRGEPMSAALARGDLMNPSICEAVHNGEQSGQIGPLLINMADFLDEENEVIVKAATSLFEPIILAALGVLVGFIAISMFLPLFDLAAMGQGGGG